MCRLIKLNWQNSSIYMKLTNKQNEELLNEIEGEIQIVHEINPIWAEYQKLNANAQKIKGSSLRYPCQYGQWRYRLVSPEAIITINEYLPPEGLGGISPTWEVYHWHTGIIKTFPNEAEALDFAKGYLNKVNKGVYYLPKGQE